MATVSGSCRATEDRSGGRTVTKRRGKPIATPYDRPPPPWQLQESPNWLTGVIFPATRRIATGAAKILSSVFDSSSSSSSSSDSEAASEDDVNNDEVNHSNKDHEIPSELMTCKDKEAQLIFCNSVTKSAIERLLMQERFSWEERNRLVQVIDERVVDPIVGGKEDGQVSDVPVAIVDNDTADPCSKAVMEARKWLEEKKVGLSPLSDLAQESGGLNFELQHIAKDAGSPVDVAKLYMRSRPPWASPLAEHIQVRTPSVMTGDLFRDGTSASLGDGSFSSSKKRNIAAGSWNIEEEIRRVRSKASEDMLSSLPSKIDLSSFTTAPKPSQDSLLADLSTFRDVGNKSNFVTGTPSIVASTDVAAVFNSSVRISALETRQDGLENETLTPHPTATISEDYQDLDAVKDTAECAGSKPNHLISLNLAAEQHCDDPRPSHRKGSPVEEVKEFEGIENVNGLHTSQERSLSGEMGTREFQEQPHENSYAAKRDGKTTDSIPLEDMCEPLSEASVEVPIVDETNGIVSVSQTSSSMQYEDLSPVLTQPYTTKMVPEADGEAVKQEVKKSGRYNRRGRGKGK